MSIPRPSVRMALLIFATLAMIKVWTQDRMFRAIVAETLVAGYHDRASELCRRAAAPLPGKGPKPALRFAAADTAFVIGAPHLDVAPWDFDNPLWDTRFRHLHLVLNEPSAGVSCAYDVTAGLASVLPNGR
ncbi:MAG: hypothetical protein ACRCS9_05930 [Hyphomicrobium sp.]